MTYKEALLMRLLFEPCGFIGFFHQAEWQEGPDPMQMDYILSFHCLADKFAWVGGRDTFKTSSTELILEQFLLNSPDQQALIFAPAEIHARPLFQHRLIAFFRNYHPFLRLFFLPGSSFRDRYLGTTLGSCIHLRIAGEDRSGEEKAIAAHVRLVVVEEAQRLPWHLIRQLRHIALAGCKWIVLGVPNDDLSSFAYGAIKAKRGEIISAEPEDEVVAQKLAEADFAAQIEEADRLREQKLPRRRRAKKPFYQPKLRHGTKGVRSK